MIAPRTFQAWRSRAAVEPAVGSGTSMRYAVQRESGIGCVAPNRGAIDPNHLALWELSTEDGGGSTHDGRKRECDREAAAHS